MRSGGGVLGAEVGEFVGGVSVLVVEPCGKVLDVDGAGGGGVGGVVAEPVVGVAWFDADGGVVDACLETDAVELADVVAAFGIPDGGVAAERVDGFGPRGGAFGAVAPVDDRERVVALVGASPGEPFGGRDPALPEDRMGVADGRGCGFGVVGGVGAGGHRLGCGWGRA